MNFHMCIPLASAAAPLPATAVLTQLEGVTYKNVEIGRRHPAAIYAMTVRTIAHNFEDALDAYAAFVADEALDSDFAQREKTLVRSLDLLLDSIAEHFDDAKCCLSLVLKTGAESKLTKSLREYDGSIREVRAFCVTQVNEMKHRQGKIELISVEYASQILWGYFIQGIGKDGEVGPNPRVHKSNTAYSFGRAFRMLATAVLFTSRALASALRSGSANRLESREYGFGPLLPIAERLSSLPRLVFWDETEVCPDFRVSDDVVEAQAPARRRWKRPPQSSRIKLSVKLEFLSDTHRLPYFGDYMAKD